MQKKQTVVRFVKSSNEHEQRSDAEKKVVVSLDQNNVERL